MTKTRKRQNIISPVFTLHRFRSLREIPIAAKVEEEDYLRREKVKIKENILFVCVYIYESIYTHTYKYNL